jgi:hypothetical protein
MEGMMNKWQIGPVKLANGSEAEITRINEGQEDFCYVGHVVIGATWHPAGWHASGRMMYTHKDTGNNLAPPPKKTIMAQEMWVAVLYNGESLCYYSQQAAKNATYGNAVFAIKKIEPFEVTEGEGLS